MSTRAVLAYSSMGTKRMRMAFTRGRGHGRQEVWLHLATVASGDGTTIRHYLFDSPNEWGIEHQVFMSNHEIDFNTFIDEIAKGKMASWRYRAQDLWQEAFGEPGAYIKAPKKGGSRVQKDSSSEAPIQSKPSMADTKRPLTALEITRPSASNQKITAQHRTFGTRPTYKNCFMRVMLCLRGFAFGMKPTYKT